MHERLAVANLALHSLAGIDDNTRETLEYIKQVATMKFEIVMGTSGKSIKEFSARRTILREMFRWQRQWLALHRLLLSTVFERTST